MEEEAFCEIYRRIVAEGRDDGIIDMGLLLLFTFTDPDDGLHEVVWWTPYGSHEGILREEWKYIGDY